MTVDATKSPTPAWQRKAVAAVLAVLVAAVAYVVWTKDLHHTAPAASSPPAATKPAPSVNAASPPASATTTVPGGLPVSGRDPFGS